MRDVNIPGGREDTSDGLGSTGTPPSIITDSTDGGGSPGLAQVNAVDFQVGIKVIIVGKTSHTGVTVSAKHTVIGSLGKLGYRRIVVRTTRSFLETQSVTNAITGRGITGTESLLDITELTSLVDGTIGRGTVLNLTSVRENTH